MRLPQLHKILVAIAWAFAAGSNLSAATWDGGNGDWTSAKGNRWGLGVGQYPGDASHGDEIADLSAEGQVVIKDGDEIRQQPRGSLSVKAGTIKQTGGILISDNIHVRARYDLLGGTVTGNGAFLVSAGGVWNVDGGELGTRVTSHDDLPKGEGAADAIFEFNGRGDGTLSVTESGVVDLHSIRMNKLVGGVARVEARGVTPPDRDAFKRSALYWQLNKHPSGEKAVARFVLSPEGITPWRILGELNLGEDDNRGALEVDVSAFPARGASVGCTLFDYRTLIGAFGEVAILSHGRPLQPGPKENLGVGQYFLEMHGGDGADIVLFFRTPAGGGARLGKEREPFSARHFSPLAFARNILGICPSSAPLAFTPSMRPQWPPDK